MVSKRTPADRWVVNRARWSTAVLLMCSGSLSACVSTRHLAPAPVTPPPAPLPTLAEPARDIVAPASRVKHDADAIVLFARSLIGTPYHWGGSSPESGFDCSGLVVYVMAFEDIGMPRTSTEQYQVGSPVAWNRLRDGDLVFFSTTGPGATHVGIIVDAEHLQFVHAPNDGSRVRIDRLDAGYWRQRWIGSRRVL